MSDTKPIIVEEKQKPLNTNEMRDLAKEVCEFEETNIRLVSSTLLRAASELDTLRYERNMLRKDLKDLEALLKQEREENDE